MSKCSECVHVGFREMIKKPCGYYGKIPCANCKHFSYENDNFVKRISENEKGSTLFPYKLYKKGKR